MRDGLSDRRNLGKLRSPALEYGFRFGSRGCAAFRSAGKLTRTPKSRKHRWLRCSRFVGTLTRSPKSRESWWLRSFRFVGKLTLPRLLAQPSVKCRIPEVLQRARVVSRWNSRRSPLVPSAPAGCPRPQTATETQNCPRLRGRCAGKSRTLFCQVADVFLRSDSPSLMLAIRGSVRSKTSKSRRNLTSNIYPGLRVLDFYYLSAGTWVVSGQCHIVRRPTAPLGARQGRNLMHGCGETRARLQFPHLSASVHHSPSLVSLERRGIPLESAAQ